MSLSNIKQTHADLVTCIAEEEEWIFVPCPLSSITKMMAGHVANNFTALFEYYAFGVTDTSFSDSITEMLRKFATDTYAVSDCCLLQ